MRQDPCEQRPYHALAQRPAIAFVDIGARMIDEMHVVHAGRAGRHAREARKAPVDVLDDLGGRRALLLQHVLDQVNAAARRSEEHTSELQSLMRISYAVFCLQKKTPLLTEIQTPRHTITAHSQKGTQDYTC